MKMNKNQIVQVLIDNEQHFEMTSKFQAQFLGRQRMVNIDDINENIRFNEVKI